MASGTAAGVLSSAPAACHAVASPASPRGTLNRFGRTLSRQGLAYRWPGSLSPDADCFVSRIPDVTEAPSLPTDHGHTTRRANSRLPRRWPGPRAGRWPSQDHGRPRRARLAAKRGAVRFGASCWGWWSARLAQKAAVTGSSAVMRAITSPRRAMTSFPAMACSSLRRMSEPSGGVGISAWRSARSAGTGGAGSAGPGPAWLRLARRAAMGATCGGPPGCPVSPSSLTLFILPAGTSACSAFARSPRGHRSSTWPRRAASALRRGAAGAVASREAAAARARRRAPPPAVRSGPAG
jgi:hypothetical protein